MERAAAGLPGVVAESRLVMPIEGITKPDNTPWIWQMSGQPDVYENGTLSDYKVTSVWSFMFGDKPEWDQQLNMQAMLHRHKGDEVTHLRIIAILRDWQRSKAKFEKDYPAVAVHVANFPVWDFDEQVAFAQRRVRLHQTAQKDFKLANYNPEALPLCTPQERWFRGAKYAVKKQDAKGKVNKKSDRLFDTEGEARDYMRDNAGGLPKGKSYAPLEERPGINIRCLDFCDVAMFCPFGKALKDAQMAEATAGKHDEEEAD